MEERAIDQVEVGKISWKEVVRFWLVYRVVEAALSLANVLFVIMIASLIFPAQNYEILGPTEVIVFGCGLKYAFFIAIDFVFGLPYLVWHRNKLKHDHITFVLFCTWTFTCLFSLPISILTFFIMVLTHMVPALLAWSLVKKPLFKKYIERLGLQAEDKKEEEEF